MIDMIMRCDFNFDSPVWKGISDEGKDFVKNLLIINPKDRLNATTALAHPWIVERERLSHEIPSEEVLSAVTDNLLAYKDTSRLKKMALNVIAHRSTSDEIVHLRKAFKAYDKANNGIIDFEEFKEALKTSDFTEDEIQEIFESVDVNKNGRIMYTEFLAATMEAHGHIEERRIAEAFDRMDSDDSGYISKQNLKELLGKDFTKEAFEEILASADTDGKQLEIETVQRRESSPF